MQGITDEQASAEDDCRDRDRAKCHEEQESSSGGGVHDDTVDLDDDPYSWQRDSNNVSPASYHIADPSATLDDVSCQKVGVDGSARGRG